VGKRTTLSPSTSRKGGTSLRSVVPRNIVNQFNLKDGDKLDWSLEARDGEIIIIVKPIKEE
jgi:antitoxin component of MazEF toxin-antitoxin module